MSLFQCGIRSSFTITVEIPRDHDFMTSGALLCLHDDLGVPVLAFEIHMAGRVFFFPFVLRLKFMKLFQIKS